MSFTSSGPYAMRYKSVKETLDNLYKNGQISKEYYERRIKELDDGWSKFSNYDSFEDYQQAAEEVSKYTNDVGGNIMGALSSVTDLITGETAKEHNMELQNAANEFTTSERIAAQEYNAEEALKARNHQTYLQKLAQEFNHDEAELNRVWQTQMSNTAYQRAFADMKEAGLNPFLAYAQGGAPMTSSQSASVGVSSSPTASINANAGKAGTVGSSAGAVINLVQSVLSTALGLAKIWK